MKLSRSNWLVRFAFLGSDWGIPEQTSLCAMFWRIVWRIVVAIVLGVVAGSFLYLCYAETWKMFLFVSGIALAIGVLLVISEITFRVHRRALERQFSEAPAPSALEETFWAIKNRVCPIITIERE